MYDLEILRSAQKQLERINKRDRERIASDIKALRTDPRPPGALKLTGRPAWRIRVGDYRVIYKIEDSRLCILVVEVGHRGDVYS